MNAIKMPGFTAGSSHYVTFRQYRNASVWKQSYQALNQTVSPALASCNNSCFRECVRTFSVDCRELSGPARALCFQNCRMECGEECCQSPGLTLPPPLRTNPCRPGWTWVSGPEWCPTCCREFSDGTALCQQPLCAPRGDDR